MARSLFLVILCASLLGSCADEEKKLPCERQNCQSFKVVAKPQIVIREKPLIDSPILGKVDFGQEISVISMDGPPARLLGLEGHWYYVQYFDIVGWVFGRLIVPERFKFDGFTVSNGQAIFAKYEEAGPTPLAGQTLAFFEDFGHDITRCKFTFDDSFETVKKNCCFGWIGPSPDPKNVEQTCKTQVFPVTGDKTEFSFDGVTYIWNRRVKGYLPQGEIDWKEVFAQAFEAKPSPEGYRQNWHHFPDTCRFCADDMSCYGGVAVNYLCDVGQEPGTPVEIKGNIPLSELPQ